MLYQSAYHGDKQGILLHKLELKKIDWLNQDQDDESLIAPKKTYLEFIKLIEIKNCSSFDFLDDCTLIGLSPAGKIFKYQRDDASSLDWV